MKVSLCDEALATVLTELLGGAILSLRNVSSACSSSFFVLQKPARIRDLSIRNMKE